MDDIVAVHVRMQTATSASSPTLRPLTARARLNQISRRRSSSDSTPFLDPSPRFTELPPKAKDDELLIATPSKTGRLGMSPQCLHLQMPPPDSCSPAAAGLGIQSLPDPYGSPSSVLPRHSRGMDFARAATNLHHSTLAEKVSPDSSPTATQRAIMPRSRRSSMYATMSETPRTTSGTGWPWPTAGSNDRNSLSRSLGTVTAAMSDGSSSSSDDDTLMGQDELDDILSTPQVHQRIGDIAHTPFEIDRRRDEVRSSSSAQSSPATNSFGNYRRNIFGKRHTRNVRDHPYQRHRTSSPEPGKPNQSNWQSASSFVQEPALASPLSRRESLSLGLGYALKLTSSNEDVDDGPSGILQASSNVVRRPVTRRSNLLPKTKNFARIRAALQEENSPVDSEARKESEVVRQVRVKDIGTRTAGGTTVSSPDTTSSAPNLPTDGSELSDLETSGRRSTSSTASHTDVWPRLNGQDTKAMLQNGIRTPPHIYTYHHRQSSGLSEDIGLVASGISALTSEAKSCIEPLQKAVVQPPNFPSAAEITQKINKRRRDDDFDSYAFKRRAVSPGLSVQSSPILGQSPQSSSGCWPTRPSRENSAAGMMTEERLNGNSYATQINSNLGTKRVGFQGMTDTNDGIMNMSIE